MQVGDKVLIKNDHNEGRCNDDCAYFVNEMGEYIGRIARIRFVSLGRRYNLDGILWDWSDCMLSPITQVAPGIYKVDKQEMKGGENTTMADFKIGDKVKRIHNNNPQSAYSKVPLGTEGEIDYISDRFFVLKDLRGTWDSCYMDDYELISPTVKISMAKTFSRLARKLLDKHTRAMVKVGWLDENLEPTADGINRVVSDYILANKEELGEDALKILKREEKKKE